MPYPSLGHSGIICYVFTLHSAPKKQTATTIIVEVHAVISDKGAMRVAYACKSKGNFEWFAQAIYHYTTNTHSHTHTERDTLYQ